MIEANTIRCSKNRGVIGAGARMRRGDKEDSYTGRLRQEEMVLRGDSRNDRGKPSTANFKRRYRNPRLAIEAYLHAILCQCFGRDAL